MNRDERVRPQIKAPIWTYRSKLLAVLVLLCALWLRAPFISSGLPYLYEEDEAHHFNRVVEMVQRGDYNPNYFHKPSLHFYLRMPVVAVSFLWGVREGHLRSLKEIKTRDPYGLAGYAMSTSHPGVVKWNRAFSVLLSLGVVALAMALAAGVSGSATAGVLAGLITAVSPELVHSSHIVGVDVPMTFFCLLCAWLTRRAIINRSVFTIFLASLVAGLAISTKYNALPIALVPLIACLDLGSRRWGCVALSVFATVLGFFGGSPYILISLPLFLDQFAYEIWHYGIAGHEGHTAEPGLPQALFYFGWLRNQALGLGVVILATIGLVAVVLRRFRNDAIVVVLFPLMFALLMINQRANFVRNMYVILPFLAILAAVGADSLIYGMRRSSRAVGAEFNKRRGLLVTLIVAIALIMPLRSALARRTEASSIDESRIAAMNYLQSSDLALQDVAVSAQLEFTSAIYKLPGVSPINEIEVDPIVAYLDGFSTAIVSARTTNWNPASSPFIETAQQFGANAEEQRVPRDPSLRIVRFKDWDQISKGIMGDLGALALHLPVTRIDLSGPRPRYETATELIDGTDAKQYFWFAHRLNLIELVGQRITGANSIVKLEMMTPWAGQVVRFAAGDWSQEIAILPGAVGSWQAVTLTIPTSTLKAGAGILVSLSQVHSPYTQALSADRRRLGLAVRVVN